MMIQKILTFSNQFELYNLFDSLIKLSSDLYLSKCLDIPTKLFFSCGVTLGNLEKGAFLRI